MPGPSSSRNCEKGASEELKSSRRQNPILEGPRFLGYSVRPAFVLPTFISSHRLIPRRSIH